MPDQRSKSASLPRMAVPLVISFTLRFVFQQIDLAYAAMLDDPGAVAALGFYIPFHGIYIAAWVGMSAGFTAAISAALARRDEARVRALKRAMRRILMITVPCLALLGVALGLAVPHMGLEPELAQSFGVYAPTILIGVSLTGFWSVYPDSIVKAHYDTRSTMVAGILATITNILLNTLFVFGFGMGLFGIALATVISRLPALAYAMHRARFHERQRLQALPPEQREPVGQVAPLIASARWSIISLGAPASLTYVLTAGESAVVNGLLTRLPHSTQAIAGFGVYHQLTMVAMMPTIAASVALLPFVARAVPEGQGEAVIRDLKLVGLICAGFGLLLTLPVSLIFPVQVATFFFDESAGTELDPAQAADLLRLLPIGLLAGLPFLLLRPVFEALHQPRIGIWMSVLRFVVLSLPCLFAGRSLASSAGIDPLLGVVGGIIVASAIASWITGHRALGMLRRATTA